MAKPNFQDDFNSLPEWAKDCIYTLEKELTACLQPKPCIHDPLLNYMGKCPQCEAVDPVNHPSHYTTGSIECIDAIEAALTPEEFRGYCKGNVLSYVWRENNKGRIEDLRKARWYLERLINGKN